MREQQILLEPKTLPNSYFGDSKRLNHQSRTANDDLASNGAGEMGPIFNFESFKSRMADVEMVTNLGQPYNNGYCHLDPIYDFKPANVEMLIMSRLAFSMKKNRILNFMRNVADRNCDVYQRFGQYKKDAFPKFHQQQAALLE